MQGTGKSKASVPSVSDPRLSRTGAPSSAANDSPEVVTIHSVPNKNFDSSSTHIPLNNEGIRIFYRRPWSLVAEGVGIVPPPIAAVSAAEKSQLADRVQHSLEGVPSQR